PCRLCSLAQVSARSRKHVPKHVRRQHAGARVVTRAVVADENTQPPDVVPPAMTERRRRAALLECYHGALVGNPPERYDGAEILHLRSEERRVGKECKSRLLADAVIKREC